ncbi:MAG: Phosphate transporter substrate-binding protein PhoT family [Verrucomicrobia bacterium]|nr:Phosphate transporter substrate-binding protein PhoT family [Verrucomicrobiota bacterium]
MILPKSVSFALRGFLGGCALAFASAAGAAPAYPGYTPQGKLDGELHCVGSDVMDTITLGWLEIFRKAHPQVAATIEARVASSAFTGLLTGHGQIGPISRPIFPSETAEFVKKFGYPPTEIRVSGGAYDTPGFSPPLVIIVHPDNPVRQITLKQIEEIYAESGTLTSWDQIAPPAGTTGLRIVPWGLRPPNGTAFVFQQMAMHGRAFRSEVIFRPLENDLSRSAQRTSSGGVKAFGDIVAGVAQDPLAIGYAAPRDVTAAVRIVPVARQDGSPAVSPGREQVALMEYPLCRFTYIYINRPPGSPIDPKVKEFLRIVLSAEGQAVVAQRSPFLPLPADILRQELAKLE